MIKYSDADQFLRDMKDFYPLAREVETLIGRSDRQRGYCACCGCSASFVIDQVPVGEWLDLRNSYLCPRCKMSSRMRLLHEVAILNLMPEDQGLIFERVTPYWSIAAKCFSNLEGVEFVSPHLASGDIAEVSGSSIVHQDMMRTSYDDEAFDFVIHSDVLEHVPDHKAALRENARILKEGGKLVFACPVYNHLSHETCASRSPSGDVVHHRPPVFHGNPLSGEGSLVYTLFGYSLLHDIQDAGFGKASWVFWYDCFRGYVSNSNPYYDIGHMWPVVFLAQK